MTDLSTFPSVTKKCFVIVVVVQWLPSVLKLGFQPVWMLTSKINYPRTGCYDPRLAVCTRPRPSS